MIVAALRRFAGDRKANVAIIFGLLLIPLMLAVGSAVDYSRGNLAKASMQAALDATALYLARSPALAGYNATQLQKAASDLFNVQFQRPDAQNVTVTATFDSATSKINVAAAATVPTVFMGMPFLGKAGTPQMNVGTSSQASWGITRLQVALALDNTGSMAQNSKLTTLKTATHQMLTQLKNAAATPGDIQVAIIPFNTDVNISSIANGNTPWIDWSNWASTGSIENGMVCGNGSHHTTVCGSANHAGWNGCVMDRNQNYDAQNVAPTSLATDFPADQSAWCLTPIMPLSFDWTALNNKVDMMVANGTTNQTIGLAWAWQALTAGTPLNAPTPKPNTQLAIVLLTDGLNTENRFTSTPSAIDARMSLACANAKAAGIIIYTVLVMSGDSSILQNCASDPGKYFVVTTASQILAVFAQIGSSLTQLRISM